MFLSKKLLYIRRMFATVYERSLAVATIKRERDDIYQSESGMLIHGGQRHLMYR